MGDRAMAPQNEVGAWRNGWFVVPHRVVFRDVDYFGHVNNAVYFTYFELARTHLWFSITGGTSPRDVGFIVVRAECDFRQQIAMEAIDIAVRIGEMRSSSFDFVYEIRKERGQQVASVGKVVVVLFDWEARSKMSIGDDLKSKVRSLQESHR
jgi:acyl-CoA thioester hydrolase